MNKPFAPRTLLLIPLLLLLVRAIFAQDDLPWHVKDRDFQPITPPQWVMDAPQIAFANGEAAVGHAIEAGAQALHTGSFSVWYPLKKDDPSVTLDPMYLGEQDAQWKRAKAAGVRIMPAVVPWAPPEMIKAHPDWMIHPEDNKEIEKFAQADFSAFQNLPYRYLCLNSPWADYYIEVMGEILKEYDFDGYSFDGNYHPQICYCNFCKEQYKAETGREIPPAIDIHNVDYRIYLLWMGDKLEKWYQRMHAHLRTINPEFAYFGWTVNAGRYGQLIYTPRVMSARQNMLYDVPMQEWWMEETHLGSSVASPFGAGLLRALSAQRVSYCAPYSMTRGNPYGGESFPAHEMLRRTMLALNNGSLSGDDSLPEVTAAVQARIPLQRGAKNMPYAALLFSEQSRQFYGMDREGIIENYLPHPFGIYRAALEEHLPVTIVTDYDLQPGKLDAYKVLILPNAACLSDEQVQVIRDFVSKGGGLIASCDTSRFDPIGRPRENFALADVFGVDFVGIPTPIKGTQELDANFVKAVGEEYVREHKNINTIVWNGDPEGAPGFLSGETFNKLVPGKRATFKGKLIQVSDAPRAPMAAMMHATPENDTKAIPAIVSGTFGAGRVVYMPAGLDGGYFTYSYPYQRELLGDMIRWSAQGEPAVRVAAPMCVETNVFTQENVKDKPGKRVIVQMFNNLDTTSNHGLPKMEVPLREEVVPIHDIKVEFEGMNAKAFRLEPEGTALTATTNGATQTVVVPRLDVQGAVVAELE